MKVVLDTNVLVSGLLRPFSASGEIVRMVSAGELRLCLDARLLTEYREVLQRPEFQFDPELVSIFLGQVEHSGVLVAGTPLGTSLPDPDDMPFLEVALAAGAECLVTGNLRHFPSRSRGGMTVLSPKQFLDFHKGHTAKPPRGRPRGEA